VQQRHRQVELKMICRSSAISNDFSPHFLMSLWNRAGLRLHRYRETGILQFSNKMQTNPSMCLRHALFFLLVCILSRADASASSDPKQKRNGGLSRVSCHGNGCGHFETRRKRHRCSSCCRFTLAVTYPEAGNIGGVVSCSSACQWIQHDDDFREEAPAAATRNMYLDSAGSPIVEKSLSVSRCGSARYRGWTVVCTPDLRHEIRAEVIDPAIDIAKRGFCVSRRQQISFDSSLALFARFESSRKILLRGGNSPKEGDILRLPDLARTLGAIRDRAPPDSMKEQSPNALSMKSGVVVA